MGSSFQGKNGMKWFFGPIVDINDPLEIGRLRVRAFGLYNSKINDNDIPWAIPVQPVTSSAKEGVGTSPTGIEVGSVAFGFFVDDDCQQPVVLGTYAGIDDVHDLVLGKNTIVKDLVGPEPVSSYAAVYPHNKVTVTKAGHVFEVDDTEGAERIHTYHKSGSYQEYQPTGIVVDKAVGDRIIVSSMDVLIHAEGDLYTRGKEQWITADASMHLNSPDVYVVGTANVGITGGKINVNGTEVVINSDGSVEISGSSIALKGNVAVTGGSFTWNGLTVKAGSISG